MRRFLYFLPGIEKPTAAAIAAAGLADRFRGIGGKFAPHAGVHIEAGPGGAGCLVCLGRFDPGVTPCDYLPNEQTWYQGEKFSVGFQTEMPPDEEQLARETGLDGYKLQLGNRQEWIVPLLRRWDPAAAGHVPNIPQGLVPVPGEARMQMKVLPQYAAAYELSGKIFSGFLESRTASADEVFRDACTVLAVNYRIGPEEVGLLGLLNTEAAVGVLKLCIDLPKIERHMREAAETGLIYREPVIEEEEV